MSGHSHDGARPVAHHDVVRDPDRDLLVVDGINGEGAGRNPRLALVEFAPLHFRLGGADLLVVRDRFPLIVGGDLVHEGMLGSQNHVGRPEEGVGSGGEDLDDAVVIVRQGEDHPRPFGPPDPVSLEQFDSLGPVEVVQLVNEALGILRNAEHPLLEGTAFNRVPLLFPLGHFFIGQDRAQAGTPVDGGLRHVGQADLVDLIPGPAPGLQFRDRPGLLFCLVEVAVVDLQEDPLGPPHVIRIGGIDLAVPVIAEAQHPELTAKVVDVVLRVDPRMLAGLAGMFFGRQSEGIPAHRMENIESLLALVAGDNVRGGVAFGVADVQPGPARVGKHVEGIELACVRIKSLLSRSRHAESLVRIPPFLPLGFELIEGIGFASLAHRAASSAPGTGRDGGRYPVSGQVLPPLGKQNPVAVAPKPRRGLCRSFLEERSGELPTGIQSCSRGTFPSAEEERAQ